MSAGSLLIGAGLAVLGTLAAVLYVAAASVEMDRVVNTLPADHAEADPSGDHHAAPAAHHEGRAR